MQKKKNEYKTMKRVKSSVSKSSFSKPKKDRRSTGQRIKLILQLVVFLVLLATAAVMLYFYINYGKLIFGLQADAKQKVYASTEDTFKASQTSIVYDMEGNVISTLKSEKDVFYLSYEDIPELAVDAMIVSEDRKFFQHKGVDYLANIRAAIALIKHKGKITQGASTITQQLARGVFLTQEVTYERKIEEIFAAQELEKLYSKTDIMEFYLNGIYFANGHYGIQAAAQGYFGEGVSSLSMSQIVFLCAIPNNPNLYNPVTNIKNTLERRDRILKQLLTEGMISQEEYQEAVKEKITLHMEKTKKKNYVETYSYYCAVRALMKEAGFTFRYQFENEEEREAYNQEYEELYNRYQKQLYTHGYRIYTSIDLKKQKLLQNSVDEALAEFHKVNKEGVYQLQGAAVCIDNDTGRVIAIVGGRGQKFSGYTLNRAYQSYRQPGSAIKPLIVYTPAFERGYTPESTVVDEWIKDGPKNSDGAYLGKMKLIRAIELSRNTVAWGMFEELTPAVGLSYLLHMNFSKIKDKDYVPAASLGGLTIGASPVEMAAAYAALENDGFYRIPTCIVKIMDSEGNEIVGDTMDTTQVYQSKASDMMTEALIGVMNNGTARGLGLTYTESAGKTGTTNDKKDGWFVGYTPYYTTSVWVGYDLPKATEDLKGATYPGRIWHRYMEQIHTVSMTKKFELYDWRALLKEAKEQAVKDNELEDAQKKAEKEEALKEDQKQTEEKALEDSKEQEADMTREEDKDLEEIEDNSDQTTEDNTSVDEAQTEDTGADDNSINEDTGESDATMEDTAAEENTDENAGKIKEEDNSNGEATETGDTANGDTMPDTSDNGATNEGGSTPGSEIGKPNMP
jgi:membrane peptidoglycan carboxypeptidase